jgi:hypothetical protein
MMLVAVILAWTTLPDSLSRIAGWHEIASTPPPINCDVELFWDDGSISFGYWSGSRWTSGVPNFDDDKYFIPRGATKIIGWWRVPADCAGVPQS